MSRKDGSLVIIIRRIGPYHAARLKTLAQGGAFRLVVLEVDPADRTYGWKAEKLPEGLHSRIVLEGPAMGHQCLGLRVWRRTHVLLTEEQPSVVAIPGWSDPTALAALAWCSARGVPTVLMSDSTAADERRRWWREAVKSRVVRLATCAFVAGQRHVEYVHSLGMPLERIETGYDVVDNEHFGCGAQRVQEAPEMWRRRYGLPERYFLVSSRFIQKKNLEVVLAAYDCYRKKCSGDAWHLVLLGDGPLKSVLETAIGDKGLKGVVHLHGFRQYDELPAYYGLAGAFILASTSDQWGLVVNEAMAAGLPVIVSQRCGCVPDLLEHGENGLVFDPHSVHELCDAMLALSEGETDRETMGKASRVRISNWTPTRFSRSLSQVADQALGTPVRKASMMDRLLMRALARRQ